MKRQSKRSLEAGRREKKAEFIHALAEYLSGGSTAMMSIRLQAGDPDAKLWAALRSTTPPFGWLTAPEAEDVLTEFLR